MQFGPRQMLRQAAQTNGRGASTICDGRERSWAETESRCLRLASAFARRGVEPGARVGILAHNSDYFLEAYFALGVLGAVAVPLNTRHTASELGFVLEDAGCSLLLADPAHEAPLREAVGNKMALVRADAQGADSIETLIADASPLSRGGELPELAAIFYTGGTTGRPKGVMVGHQALFTNALMTADMRGLAQRPVWLHSAPMFHMSDHSGTIAMTVAAGTHHFIPKFDARDFVDTICSAGITDVFCVPTMVGMLLDAAQSDRSGFSALRRISYGAAPMSPEMIRRAMDLFPYVSFAQGYGQTEAGPALTQLLPERHILEGPLSGKLNSVGQAAWGVELAILDPYGAAVAEGEAGEICARTPAAMLGYWRRAKETEDAFRGGWLHTGDVGRLDEDGFLYLLDRLKDMIITGGENVYSVEVENTLQDHPGVSHCAVIGVPDDVWGERVEAVVRLREGHEVTSENLVAFCRSRIAGYKCPKVVHLAETDLPLSAAGKVLKRDIRDSYVALAEGRPGKPA